MHALTDGIDRDIVYKNHVSRKVNVLARTRPSSDCGDRTTRPTRMVSMGVRDMQDIN